MISAPGVNVFLHGDEAAAKAILPAAFKVLEDYRRDSVAIGETPPIAKLQRKIDGGSVVVKMYNGQVSLHITAAAPGADEQRPEGRPGRRIERERDRSVEQYDFIRLYLHVDILLKTAFSPTDESAYVGYLDAEDVASAVAAVTVDPATMLPLEDYVAVSIAYINVEYSVTKSTWPGMYATIGSTVTDILNHYETVLPAEFGSGMVATDISALPFFIDAAACANVTANHPWVSSLVPWKLKAGYQAAADAHLTSSIAGCCVDCYHEYQSGTTIEWSKANNLKKTRPSDDAYGCDLVAAFERSRGAPDDDTLGSLAYYSLCYGTLFNGTVEDYNLIRVSGDLSLHSGPVSIYPWTGDRYQLGSPGLLLNGNNWTNPDQVTDCGFNASWRMPDGLCWYGEAIMANQVVYDGSDYNFIGIVNINATIGRDLDPFVPGLSGMDETTVATAAYVELFKRAVAAAGGVILENDDLDARLATNQLTFWGHDAVDIRGLAGTVCGSPIINVKAYAAPIRTHKETFSFSEMEVDNG